MVYVKVVAACALLLCSACASTTGSIDRGDLGHMTRSLNTRSYGYTIIPDPTGTAPTAMVERFEVRDGDCAFDGYWSDCATDRERSELTQPKYSPNRFSNGSETWVGWWIYFPEGFESGDPASVNIGQFHEASGSGVSNMFKASYGGYYFDNHLPSNSDLITLIPREEAIGRWHRIELHVRWSRKSDGFFEVYVNGDRKVNYHARTMRTNQVYFKYGIYRSHIDRFYKAKPGELMPTQIVYFAGVKAGETRADIQVSEKELLVE